MGQALATAALAKALPDSGACSFRADTPVATEDGETAIGDLRIGDHVLAYNQTTGDTGSYTVTKVLVHTDPLVIYLTIHGERIETTPDHPFYTHERGWSEAGELRIGEHVWQADGRTGAVQAVVVVPRAQMMYNLTVAQAHTFFVGSGQWLVHNTCGPISMDEAIELAHNHAGQTAVLEQSGSGGMQFRGQPYTDASGRVITRIGRLDVNLASRYVQEMGGPHLNLEVQINGRPVRGMDPHIPIDPVTIRRGDYP